MGTKKGSDKCQYVSFFAIVAILVLQIVALLVSFGVIPTGTKESVPCKTDPGLKSEEVTDGKHSGHGGGDKEAKIDKSFYGRNADGEDIYKYSFMNKNGLELEILTLGGTITKLTVPCRHGHLRDVILGFDKAENYLQDKNPAYLGPLVGRFANRIGRGRFTLDGETYQLNTNDGQNHLHGGVSGWSHKVWKAEQHADHVSLSYTSPDGDENYPGEVKVTVTYQLTDDNEVIINYTARAYKKATPINLTTHPYFNLGGQSNRTIHDHNVTIYADKYVEVDDELIPTGNTPDVSGTLLDLTTPVRLGERLRNFTDGSGYDHTFILKGPTGKRLAAKVYHPHSGRIMEVYTNQPGVQFYTGNFLNVTCGKGCQHYGQYTGFCLETQNYPDAINQPSFPDCVLHPGSTYLHQVWYKFYTD